MRADREEQRRLYEAHRGLVYAACLSVVRRADLAEEHAEEAWVAILAGLRGFHGRSSILSWLYRVAVLTSRRLLRAERRRRSRDQRSVRASPAGQEGESSLMDAVLQLPSSLRTLLLMHALGEYSYQECARALGLPVGTVSWRICRARRLLAAELRL